MAETKERESTTQRMRIRCRPGGYLLVAVKQQQQQNTILLLKALID